MSLVEESVVAFEALETEPERDPNRRRAYTPEEAVALAHLWQEVTGAPPTKREWNPSQQISTVRRLLGRIERLNDSIDRFRDGGYPAETTVRKLFGSWEAYIAACGWEPRGQGRPRIQAATEAPATPSRDQLLRGAGTHLDARRRQQLLERVDCEGVGAAVLAARLRGVAMAQKEGDNDWLAGELEGLAGVALAWSDRLRAPSAVAA